jgi:hypothetical protein
VGIKGDRQHFSGAHPEGVITHAGVAMGTTQLTASLDGKLSGRGTYNYANGTAMFMWENGRMAKSMARAPTIMQMAMFMWENGRTTNAMDMAPAIMQMVLFMWENGRMTKYMDMAHIILQAVRFITSQKAKFDLQNL